MRWYSFSFVDWTPSIPSYLTIPLENAHHSQHLSCHVRIIRSYAILTFPYLSWSMMRLLTIHQMLSMVPFHLCTARQYLTTVLDCNSGCKRSHRSMPGSRVEPACAHQKLTGSKAKQEACLLKKRPVSQYRQRTSCKKMNPVLFNPNSPYKSIEQ